MGAQGIHHAFVVHFYGDIAKVQLEDLVESFSKGKGFNLYRSKTSRDRASFVSQGLGYSLTLSE